MAKKVKDPVVNDAAVQLSGGKKKLVNFGNIMLCVSVACYGLVFVTLCSNILTAADPTTMYPCSQFYPLYGMTYNTSLAKISAESRELIAAGTIETLPSEVLEAITKGCNNVFLVAGVITLIATILAIVWVRPVLNREKAQ